MLEIYNEKVHDLLIDTSLRTVSGLKVREHKDLGIFIEGLSKYQCLNYNDVEAIIEKGNKNRSIASTLMNNTSSRAHTIVRIEIKQLNYDEMTQQTLEIMSVINLVDLAGSERIGKTGAQGDRLKEGTKIN